MNRFVKSFCLGAAMALALPALADEGAAANEAAKPADAAAAEATTPKDDFKSNEARISYALGVQMMQRLPAKEDLVLDNEAFLKAVNDSLGGGTPAMEKTQAQQVLRDFSQDLSIKRQER
ncbi:hypothetical protein HZA57_00800, partial [Candidatus Poribacteria bacterium]|nr:hypothetical protein [Candidatus Poribacteria bacterium]